MHVRDRFALDDDDVPRYLDSVMLYTFAPIAPVPPVIRYAFPYARSSRGQIRFRYAYVKVQHAR